MARYYEVYAKRYIGDSVKTEMLSLDPEGLVEIVFVLEGGGQIAISVERGRPDQLCARADTGRLILRPLGGVNVVGLEVENW